MTNINPLYTNAYKFVLGRGNDKLELFGQMVSVPGVQLNTQPQPTTLGTQIPIAVNTFTFDPLSLNFIVDEKIENWKSIYDWMKAIGNISNDTENTTYQSWSSYATLYILNTCYTPMNGKTFTFYHLIPTALSTISFRSDVSDTNPVNAKVTFAYSYYDIS